MTGYDIKKYIEEQFGIFYKASYGNIYPALKQLAKKECVKCIQSADGKRQKNYYHITENGQKKFMEWLMEPIDIAEGVNVNLAKLHFYDVLPNDVRNRQLKEYIGASTQYLEKLEELEEQQREQGKQQSSYYERSTLYYGILIIRKQIEWYKHIYARESLDTLHTT